VVEQIVIGFGLVILHKIIDITGNYCFQDDRVSALDKETGTSTKFIHIGLLARRDQF